MNTFSIVFLQTLFTIYANCELIQLQNGIINGTIGKSKNGRLFYQFYAIPYAEPPIGELRFKAPVATKSWSGIKDCSKPPPICIQPQRFFPPNSSINGQEDCLYLNVFVPKDLLKRTTRTAVIIGIHGGAFRFGTGNDYSPDYFMDKDIVFVTLNYRMGALGFFGMNNDQISGNFGMKDQSMALQWVNQNIAIFGGNPHDVTLLGNSAGAASVHLHMFSPLSKGLFHKAIMQSGNAFSAWSHYDEGYGESTASAFLTITGCFRKSALQILKCLHRIPAREFYALEEKLHVLYNQPAIVFKPMIESNVKGGPFLPQKPKKTTYQTTVPWITGINSRDGTVFALEVLSNAATLENFINADRKQIIPLMNKYYDTADPENMDSVTQKIIDFYLTATKSTEYNAMMLKYVDMFTDSSFIYPCVKMVQSNPNQQFVYLYDHKGSFSVQNFLNLSIDLGVGHADELPLLFRNTYLESKWTPKDKKVSEILLNFWVNFAIFGDPNGNSSDEKAWKPKQTDDIEYLRITSDSVTMEKQLLKQKYEFWESLETGWKQ